MLQLPIPLSTTVTAASGPNRPHAQTAPTPATANSAIGLNPANSSLGIIDNAASGLGHRNKNPNTSGGGQHNNQSPLSHNPVGASNNVPIGPQEVPTNFSNINPNQHHHNNNDQDMSKTPVFSNLASGMYNNPRQNNYGYNANNNPSGLAASSSSLMFQNRPTPSSPQAPLPYNNNNMQPYQQIQTMQPSMHTMMLNNNSMRNTRMSYGGIAQNQSGGVFNPPFGGQVGRGSISNNPIGVGNMSNNAGNFGGMGTNFNAQQGIIPNSTQFNNPLSKVTVGGTTTINSNQNKHLAMNRNNNNNINSNSNAGGSGWGMGGRGIFGNRAREINAKSRPPLQPMTSTSGSAGSRDLSPVLSSPGMVNQQQQNHLSHQRSMHRTNFDGNDGSVGTAGDDGSLILAGADAASITHDAQEEVALTTGLVTLSVHEALTFGEVELALHPDVFLSPHSLPANSTKTKGKSSEGSAGGKSNGMLGGKLCPGDLVEIRVWAARPEFNKRSILPSKSKAGSSSVMKSKASANSSLHSRNPSLFSVSSASMSLLSPGMGSVRGSSLYGTPIPSGSASNKHRSVSSHIPPLPSIIGGDGPSPMDGSVGGYSSTGSLYGERLLESSDEVGASTDGSRSGVLYGEDLLDTPVAKETPGTMSHISSAASTLLAGGASLLFRNLNQPSSTPSNPSVTNATMPTAPSLTIDQTMSSIASPELGTLPGVAGDASTISHSRDSSLVTNSTVGAMHSRDSSILTNTAWMNALNTSSSQDNMHQTSPLANNKLDASISISDTVRSNRPGSTESHVLPMRRDGPLMATSTAATMNLPPPHPLALHSTAHGVSTLDSGTSTPTPSSLPSSPRITPHSTPPTSIPKPPVPLQYSTSSPIGDSNNQSSSETIKFDLTVTGNDRRLRSSTSDAPVAPSPSHTRNHSIGITGLTGVSSVTNTVDVGDGGVHRRHSSSIQTSYSSGPLLPPSLAKVSEAKDDVDQSSTTNDSGSRETNKNNTIEDAMELMQRTHFVRVSFVMPVSKGSLTSIKSGARTQVSLLKKGKCVVHPWCLMQISYFFLSLKDCL